MADKIFRALPVVLLLAVMFLVGFIAPDVGASRGNLSEFAARLQQLPDRMKMLVDLPDEGNVELPVLQTYYEVLGKLRDDYYGKKIDDREMTYNAIRGMLQSLDDPYTRFLDPDSYKRMREENEGNFVGIGAQLKVNNEQQVFIKEPLPNSPALEQGVKAGDIILNVDGKPIVGLDIDQVVERIRGEEGTKVRLSLLRGKDKKPIEVTIVRRVVQLITVQSKMLDDGIGYLRLHQFNEHSDGQMETALSELEKGKMRGLILDLRRNPGGLLRVAVEIGSRFVENGPIVIIQERTGERSPLNVIPSKHNHKRYPLVVLVDGESASASEIVSGAIQDNNAGTLVGVDTFGKARVQTVSPLKDGSAIAVTTAKYLTPKGRDINKVGVKPDIKIESPEMAELGDPAVDTQLAKAVEILKEKVSSAK